MPINNYVHEIKVYLSLLDNLILRLEFQIMTTNKLAMNG